MNSILRPLIGNHNIGLFVSPEPFRESNRSPSHGKKKTNKSLREDGRPLAKIITMDPSLPPDSLL